MAKKQTSDRLSSIAGRVMARGKPGWMPLQYWKEIMRPLAASVLSQDEKKRPAPPKRNA